jgi:serine acetyltransferase
MSRRLLPRTVSRAGRRWFGEAIRRSWETAAKYGAIHPESVRAERFGRLGAGSLLSFPLADIFGERWMDIGEEVLVSPGATLTVGYGPEQVEGLGPDPHLVIGDRCMINVGCMISAHTKITLGDDVWLGRNVFITDTNHGYTDLDVPIGRQMGPCRPVSIGAGSWLGYGSVVLAGSTIGRHVVVAAGSVVTGDVPDRCVVAGAPARIVRRHIEGETWERVRADLATAVEALPGPPSADAPPLDPLLVDPAVESPTVDPALVDPLLAGSTVDPAPVDPALVEPAVVAAAAEPALIPAKGSSNGSSNGHGPFSGERSSDGPP